mmetsp:Transcript_26251/g.31736  ORF Transcript_26251/g.31736 Transcript_26251/m.31736 type:complete len:213 (+) Transcript_26251:944-1582(+)
MSSSDGSPSITKRNSALTLITAGAPFFLLAPYLSGIVGLVLSGWASDGVVHRCRHVSVLTARKICMSIGMFGPALVFASMAAADPSTMDHASATARLSVALFCGRWAVSGYWTNMLDLRPEHAATLMGVSNTLATLPGIFGNLVTGRILGEENDWGRIWKLTAAVYFVGGVQYLFLAQGPPPGSFKRKRKVNVGDANVIEVVPLVAGDTPNP